MYYVLQTFKYSLPSCIFKSSIYEDAVAFAAIMHRTNPDTEYIVVKEA